MGWGSAVNLFDRLVGAVYDAVREFPQLNQEEQRKLSLSIINPIARELENGDWDTQQDSGYFEELQWDVFPKIAEELEKDRQYCLEHYYD